MFSRKPSHLIVALIAALGSMLGTVQCSKTSNPAPAPTPTALTVSGVTVSPGSIAPGGSAQGTVTLVGHDRRDGDADEQQHGRGDRARLCCGGSRPDVRRRSR